MNKEDFNKLYDIKGVKDFTFKIESESDDEYKVHINVSDDKGVACSVTFLINKEHSLNEVVKSLAISRAIFRIDDYFNRIST